MLRFTRESIIGKENIEEDSVELKSTCLIIRRLQFVDQLRGEGLSLCNQLFYASLARFKGFVRSFKDLIGGDLAQIRRL
jgi:hypothetical protein